MPGSKLRELSEPLQMIDTNENAFETNLNGDVDTQDANNSTLASGTLSSKKKEALSQVPCKFFRSNGCSAGNACPFAHIAPGEGQGKAVCQWFLKGSCRFGHKCALAHILPGQPISMDRKNKRAAQHMQQQQQQQQFPHSLRQDILSYSNVGGLQGSHVNDSERFSHSVFGQNQHTFHHTNESNSQIASTSRLSQPNYANSHREAELLFGIPDDLQDPISIEISNGNPSMPNTEQFPSNRSNWRNNQHNMTMSESASDLQYNDILRTRRNKDVALPSTQAFGTSPFSNPGSQSVFYSHREPSTKQEEDRTRSYGNSNRDVIKQGEDIWKDIVKNEITDREEINEEDFLPSSLSDLLTPAELQRRSKGAIGKSSLQFSPQSMPARTVDDFTSWIIPSMQYNVDKNASMGSFDQNIEASSLLPLGTLTTGSKNQNFFGTSNTSAGFLTSSTRRGLANAPIPADTDPNLPGEAIQGVSYSPSASTEFAHAPGQSLPQGLAAGLSRLHLQRLDQDRNRLNRHSNDSLSTSNNSSIWRDPKILNHSNHKFSSSGSKLSEDLGPIAPSSIFAHKTPIHLSTSQKSGFGLEVEVGKIVRPHSLEAQLHANNNNFLSTSANGSSGSAGGGISSSPNIASRVEKGITIPTNNENSILSSTQTLRDTGRSNDFHPIVQRVRSSAPGIGSPLAIPTHTEEVEEAIFELE